ncbi:hypothetical protein [uncultured Comamonas sp.]|uniref:hypothetical protein n=1 Tax=uncultured Comamonas sp. TaxID=114710 RepID=UPI00374A313D
MAKDKLFIYPDRRFADDAQLELRKLKDIAVLVRTKFARFILVRAIDGCRACLMMLIESGQQNKNISKYP